MKVLLKRRSIIIASTALLVAILSIITINLFNTGGPVTGLVSAVSTPLRALSSTVARTFEGIYASIYRYDSLMENYERALRDIAAFERDAREIIELREENDMLRAMLEFRGRHAEQTGELANISEWSSANWSSSFTINRGHANSDIEPGQAVVTEYGVVVGQVTRVEATLSTVVTVLDTTFSLSALVGEAGGTATLRGDFEYMHSGLMVLDHMEDDIVVMVGDTVVTSGIGGVFPPGMVIGEVAEMHTHITGIGSYATVSPIRDISTLLHVLVITEFGEAGLD
jgi:rod shape-determining protein MreC